jgi:hypothetical protein
MSNGDDQSTDSTWYPSASPAPRAEPAEAPGAPPVDQGTAPPSTWDKILQQAAPKYTGQPGGTTTVFATPKDLANFARTHSLATGDNGIGHPALGKVNTANSFGVAVPKDIMTKLYGGKADDPSTTANWRTARAQITINGQTYVVPNSDLGPGSGPQAAGRVTDFTSYMARGAGWMKDDDDGPVQIKLLPPGSGPDYLTDRKGWNSEQEDLRKQLFRPEPETTPWASPGGIRVPTSAQPGGAPQTFQNPASGNIEPVQSFAKGGMVLPISAEEPDEGYGQSFQHHLGGYNAAVNV